jgi:hypothetical protein
MDTAIETGQSHQIVLTPSAGDGALLHCAKLEQARSLIRVGQIAGVRSPGMPWFHGVHQYNRT